MITPGALTLRTDAVTLFSVRGAADAAAAAVAMPALWTRKAVAMLRPMVGTTRIDSIFDDGSKRKELATNVTIDTPLGAVRVEEDK